MTSLPLFTQNSDDERKSPLTEKEWETLDDMFLAHPFDVVGKIEKNNAAIKQMKDAWIHGSELRDHHAALAQSPNAHAPEPYPGWSDVTWSNHEVDMLEIESHLISSNENYRHEFMDLAQKMFKWVHRDERLPTKIYVEKWANLAKTAQVEKEFLQLAYAAVGSLAVHAWAPGLDLGENWDIKWRAWEFSRQDQSRDRPWHWLPWILNAQNVSCSEKMVSSFRTQTFLSEKLTDKVNEGRLDLVGHFWANNEMQRLRQLFPPSTTTNPNPFRASIPEDPHQLCRLWSEKSNWTRINLGLLFLVDGNDLAPVDIAALRLDQLWSQWSFDEIAQWGGLDDISPKSTPNGFLLGQLHEMGEKVASRLDRAARAGQSTAPAFVEILRTIDASFTQLGHPEKAVWEHQLGGLLRSHVAGLLSSENEIPSTPSSRRRF